MTHLESMGTLENDTYVYMMPLALRSIELREHIHWVHQVLPTSLHVFFMSLGAKRMLLQGVQKFHEIVMWYFSQPNMDES